MLSIFDTSVAVLVLAGSGLACNLVSSVKLTNYGYPDASGVPSYSCQNGQPVQPGTSTKLGDGSFNNPYAAAAAVNSNTFKKCAKVYVPILEKYFIIQDDCSGCREWFSYTSKDAIQVDEAKELTFGPDQTPDTWIDLYLVQSNQNIGQSSCEAQFGTLSYNANAGPYQHKVLVNPGAGYLTNSLSSHSPISPLSFVHDWLSLHPVWTSLTSSFLFPAQPLFQSGACYNQASQGRVYPDRDRTARCAASANAKESPDPSLSNLDSLYLDTPLLDTTPGDFNATSTDPAVSKVVPEVPGSIPDGTPAPSLASKLRFAAREKM